MDTREMLRRLRQGQSNRAIAKEISVDRKTVARHRGWAQEQDLLAGSLRPVGDLHQLLKETLNSSAPPQNISKVEPYREVVVKLPEGGAEIAAIPERLREQGYTGSYASVYRFLNRLEPPSPDATVRVETRPGEEWQVDFGYAGKMIDPETGELRKTWAFVMTLSWSRHQYVEFVPSASLRAGFDQKVETWLCQHRNVFAFLGGVPERIVPDDLKAAIIRRCWGDAPQGQQSFRECAKDYDFLIAPCRPRKPEHKGKAESGVRYVKRSFLGGREPTTIEQANQDARRWVDTTAGQRIHGAIKEKPLERFKIEQRAPKPVPISPYHIPVWKRVKLHRDCHLVFEQAYYSAPFRLVGQELWVRGGTQEVQVYTSDYKLVAPIPAPIVQRPCVLSLRSYRSQMRGKL